MVTSSQNFSDDEKSVGVKYLVSINGVTVLSYAQAKKKKEDGKKKRKDFTNAAESEEESTRGSTEPR